MLAGLTTGLAVALAITFFTAVILLVLLLRATVIGRRRSDPSTNDMEQPREGKDSLSSRIEDTDGDVQPVNSPNILLTEMGRPLPDRPAASNVQLGNAYMSLGTANDRHAYASSDVNQGYEGPEYVQVYECPDDNQGHEGPEDIKVYECPGDVQ